MLLYLGMLFFIYSMFGFVFINNKVMCGYSYFIVLVMGIFMLYY